MPNPPPNGTLVRTSEHLRELIGHLREAGRFALDTEFISEDRFEPSLCLIQVATSQRLALVDPLAPLDIEPLWDAVLDPGLEVVMHAASEDLRICLLQTGRLPERLMDVQIGAALSGHGYPVSLSNLVRQELGISLSGSETRTDWRKRPLSEAQIEYALDDVRHLLALADCFQARMSDWNRQEWAEAEYRTLIESIKNRAEQDDRWRRLPGLNPLSRRSLEACRRLFHWRLEKARESDRPARQVLRDDLLVAIARRQPSSRRDLEALRDFNRPHLFALSREILDLMEEASNVPEHLLPAPPERRDDRPGFSMVVNLLGAAISCRASEERVATALLGSVNDIRDFIAWFEAGCAPEEAPALASGWRQEVCGQTLRDVLSGRQSLRIHDPRCEVPVRLESWNP